MTLGDLIDTVMSHLIFFKSFKARGQWRDRFLQSKGGARCTQNQISWMLLNSVAKQHRNAPGACEGYTPYNCSGTRDASEI